MNRRGFLRAVGATGLWLFMTRPALLSAAPKKTADELIRQALIERRVVQFKYHGYSRRVEPHALGRARPDHRLPRRDGRPRLNGAAYLVAAVDAAARLALANRVGE